MTTRDDIVEAARGWIGTPYVHQASCRGHGTDCLGLIRGVWREVMGAEPEAVPAYTPDWAEAGLEEELARAASRHLEPAAIDDIAAGDVILFRWRPHLPAKHAAIATSARRMVHAQEGVAVAEVNMSRWWRQRLSFVFRFPGVSA